MTPDEWEEFRTEYKKYWEEHKEEIKRDMLVLFKGEKKQ